MALRGQSGAAVSTSATSISLTYAGANNIVAGDLLLLASCLSTGGGEGTITDPSGWTSGPNLAPALADVNIASSSGFLHLAAKIATSGDVGTPTYVTSSSNAGLWAQVLFAFSGRKNSSIGAAFGNQVATASSAELATPASYDLTGLTALAGDDVLAIVGIASPFGRTGTTYSLAISGYGNAINTIGTAQYCTGLSGVSYTDVPAGAIGTLASTISAVGTAQTIAMGGFVLSLPSAASGPPPSQFFLGAHLLPLALPLWIIDRRRRLARRS